MNQMGIENTRHTIAVDVNFNIFIGKSQINLENRHLKILQKMHANLNFVTRAGM